MRIDVPAGRQLVFRDADGEVLQAPVALQLARSIELPGPDVYAARTETAAQVLANRVGVTGALFALAMGAAVVLGRPRP